eukprot:12302397-Ditylum_brightwellii.AAC.1
MLQNRELKIFQGKATGAFAEKGTCLWKKESEDIRSAPNMGKYMQEWRLKQITQFVPFMFKDPLLQDVDPWWHFVSLCHQFNNNRQTAVAALVYKTFDDFMSAYKPRRARTGSLPHISYIKQKLLGMFIGMELQLGSSDTVGPYNEDLGAYSAVSLCLSRLGKQCGQMLYSQEMSSKVTLGFQ